ncbi:phage scaffolding protein [Pseudobacillus sp. FSL P4-0506]|uniref:phage scaffolding protein n=1 Tax=Pseudobacillus TaxID=108525 RepID=UPI001CBD44C8|nr:phage scaffolding protein [Bacillus badius]UAT29418.1 phage scaffolding protein [Bacillus badius]
MNREFLKGLGLEEEAINSIMAEHGKTVNTTKEELQTAQTEVKSLKDQLKDRDTQLEELSGKATGNDELKAQIEALKQANQAKAAEYEQKLQKQTYDYALDRALMSAKARNPLAVKALLDTDAIKLDGDKLLGLDDQLNKLRESDGYLFEGEAEPPKPSGYTPGSGQRGNNPKPKDAYEAGKQRALERHQKEEK